jgi:hypothetical protein
LPVLYRLAHGGDNVANSMARRDSSELVGIQKQ